MAQLVSAIRTALGTSSGPILLKAGLQLATKILTNGIISGDQIAAKRIFSLISHPLNNFEDLYYPSFAEWVSCKIKVRLLTTHASLKCYTYAFLRKQHAGVPDEYLAQLPLFSKSSSVLGKYWISILKDYSYVCFRLHLKQKWKPFLDGIQSPLVSTKLQPCLEEAWPVILQAAALDAVPVHFDMNLSSQTTKNNSNNTFISGYSMVQLKPEEFQFLWGFALLVLFQGQDPTLYKHLICLSSAKAKFGGDSPVEDTNPLALKLFEIVLPVFHKVHGRDVHGGYKRSDINGRERNTKWDFWFGESWISFGIDGAFGEWKDYTSKSARWQGERVDTRRIGFVTQDDVLFPHLTVRETLTYAALLRLPKTLTKQEKEKRAIDVIDELGLESSFVQGVSGGERKRVCIGNEIIIYPSLLFLDEPTSGLDSTTALRIVQILQDIAEGLNEGLGCLFEQGGNDFEIYDSERTVGHIVFAFPKPVVAGDSNCNLLPKGLRSSRND
ncbi:unnamed protein product [Camellia sinensis]